MDLERGHPNKTDDVTMRTCPSAPAVQRPKVMELWFKPYGQLLELTRQQDSTFLAPLGDCTSEFEAKQPRRMSCEEEAAAAQRGLDGKAILGTLVAS